MKTTSTTTCKSILMAFLILFVESAYAFNQVPGKRGSTNSTALRTLTYIPAIIMVLSFLIAMIVLFFRLKNDRNQKLGVKTLCARDGYMEQSEIKTTTPLKPEMSRDLEAAALKRLKKFEDKHEYLAKNITLTTLAALLNTNTKYSTAIILKNRGKNIVDYLKDLKINYVIGLLRTEPKYRHYNKKALSSEAGFRSVKTFSRAFKTTYGQPFSEFMEIYATDIFPSNNF